MERREMFLVLQARSRRILQVLQLEIKRGG